MSMPVEKLITKTEAKKAERIDPLKAKQQPPDRVFYATGVLLDAEDFSAEQTYHRAQLARAPNSPPHPTSSTNPSPSSRVRNPAAPNAPAVVARVLGDEPGRQSQEPS